MTLKNKIKARIFLWWHKLVYQLKRIQLFLFRALDAVAITFALLILGSLLFLFTDIQASFFKTYSPESVLVSVAATIGTIVAIVFGLAVIPVQRAAEAFSPSVLRIYARDWRGRAVFSFMGIACVLVFSISVKGVAGAPN
jgi:uncharacterized membrane protein